MYEELVKVLQETDISDGCPCGAEEWCKDKDCIIFQAADAIEDLITVLTASNEVIAKSKPKWIPVTERLPETGKKVLVFAYGHDILTARMTKLFENVYPVFECNGIFREMAKPGRITHWMPLPEPPKADKDGAE